MMRTLIMLRDFRTAHAVFTVASMPDKYVEFSEIRKIYPAAMAMEDGRGDFTQFGYGTCPRELLAKYGGKRWDAVHWRWDSPVELRAVLLPFVSTAEVA